MRLACLAPGDEDGVDGAAAIADIARGYGVDDVDTYRPHHGELPGADAPAYDAVVVSGSAAHVYDRQDWVGDTQDYVRAQAADGIPVLGVCYGHQLVGDAYGADVVPMTETDTPDEREMGFREIRQTAAGQDSPLFADVPDPLVSFTSHLDTLTGLPDDMAVLAENDYGVQALAVDDVPVYGVQFHPEYDVPLAEGLVRRKDLGLKKQVTVNATIEDEALRARSPATEQVIGNVLETARD